MKVAIERAALLKAMSRAQGVVERKNTIPILSNVLIEAEGDKVSLRATDLDIEIIEELPAMVEQAGATTVAAHLLHEIVRKLPDGAQLNLNADASSGRLDVLAGRSRFSLATLPREDFPVMASSEYQCSYALLAPIARRLFDKSKFAVSTEETRYYLNGVYLHVAEEDGQKVLRAVATDGHRLAQVEQPVPEGAIGMPGVILPRKTVGEIRKLVDEYDGAVDLGLSDTKIRFSFNETVVTSKLIDGTFPDYSRVIPRGNDKDLQMDCRLFAEAVDRVSTISSDKTRSVKLSIDKDVLTLSVNSPEAGSAVEELAAAYDASPMEIGFNSRYLLDILSQVEGETVDVKLADPSSPTVLRDMVDEAALYVLMPMRV